MPTLGQLDRCATVVAVLIDDRLFLDWILCHHPRAHGFDGRAAPDILTASWAWSYLEFVARGSGICPRCSAPVDQSVTVCEDHDDTDDACERCGRSYAAHFQTSCTNCVDDWSGIAPGLLLSTTELQAFLTAHGINIVAPETIDRSLRALGTYKEEIVSTDPFSARFTFSVDGDTLTLTVHDALTVVEATTHSATESI